MYMSHTADFTTLLISYFNTQLKVGKKDEIVHRLFALVRERDFTADLTTLPLLLLY